MYGIFCQVLTNLRVCIYLISNFCNLKIEADILPNTVIFKLFEWYILRFQKVSKILLRYLRELPFGELVLWNSAFAHSSFYWN